MSYNVPNNRKSLSPVLYYGYQLIHLSGWSLDPSADTLAAQPGAVTGAATRRDLSRGGIQFLLQGKISGIAP